jgi:hypothetical protein
MARYGACTRKSATFVICNVGHLKRAFVIFLKSKYYDN